MSYYNPSWMSPDSPNDRRTKALNKLIYGLYRKDILSEKSTLRSLFLVKSYTHSYTIVFEMDGDYRSDDTLIWIIISTVDKILEWWDITDSYNLDIEYITRGRIPINKNYFELLFRLYINNNRGGVDNFHPRFEKMCRWMYNNKYHEYQAAINRTYDPYRYQEYPQAQEFIRQRAQYRGEGIQPGYSDYSRGGEDFYQRVQQISQYYNGGYRQEEQSNLTVTQRVKKESLITRLKNNLKW
jgi:hypothetical protein